MRPARPYVALALSCIGCGSSGRVGGVGATTSSAPAIASVSGSIAATADAPPPSRAEVDAALADGVKAWSEGRDDASREALRRAGRGLARLGENVGLEIAFATEVPTPVGEGQLVAPVCFQFDEQCALLDVRVSKPAGGAPRRAWIDRVLRRTELPPRVRTAGGLPLVVFNEAGAWLYPTLDRAIDLGPGFERAEVGPRGRAALVSKDTLRLIDTSDGKDLLSSAVPATTYGWQFWPKDGAWFASCSVASGEGAFVIDAATGAVLFREDAVTACALDESAGVVAFVRRGEAKPTLRTWTVGEKKERGSTAIVGATADQGLTLRLDAPSHVVGIRYEPYHASVVSYGNYDVRTLAPAAPAKAAPRATPFDGLPVGSKYQDVAFPDVSPLVKLASANHQLMGSYEVTGADGYHWTGGRSADGRSAALIEDLPPGADHDRALLIVDTKSEKVRARIPYAPARMSFGDWEIAMFLDDHTIVVRSGSDQWLVDADAGTILFTIGTGGMNFIVPTLLPNGLLAQTGERGLELYDMGTGSRPTTPAPWDVPRWLAPPVNTEKAEAWTKVETNAGTLFVKRTGEIESIQGGERKPALDAEIPPWILCRVGDALYPVAVCQGALSK